MDSRYKLRAQLVGHEADVRGVTVSPGGVIATASRDKKVIIWNLNSREPEKTLTGHSHFVTDLTFANESTLISSSNDKTLRIWNIETGETTAILEGHEAAVCAVSPVSTQHTGPSSTVPSRRVVSCSWDNTARVWDLDSAKCIHVLTGHSAAVWNACILSDGRVVTVAADKQVRIWNLDNATPTSQSLPAQHTDVVRDVCCSLPGSITTVANDSSMVHWLEDFPSFKVTSRLTDVHDGNYIYSLDAKQVSSTKWQFISGGEDNALRICKLDEIEGQLTSVQTIMHPGTVWSVAASTADFIVTGCSDGIARVFTCDEDKVADNDMIEAFEKAVSVRQVSSKIIGGVDVSKLPDASTALAAPGKKDGENKLVRTAQGKAEVMMWSESDQRWTKVGDVVDGPDGGSSQTDGTILGKHYDFVFEVEVGEGGKKEKLGFNRGENPYTAAQRFIDDNELDQEFLDQIAQFIEQQVPADAIAGGEGTLSDPLTGGSRYVPRSGSAARSGNGGDPLTGGSRYVPKSSGGSNAALPPPRKLLPYRDGIVSYKSSEQLEKIQAKLVEINTELTKEGSDKALNLDEGTVFGTRLMEKLKARGGQEIIWEDKECDVVEKLMKWPTSKVFAALDVARLVIASASGGAYLFGKRNGVILDDVLGHLRSAEANVAVYIMGCRFLCNLFGNRVVGSVMRSRMGEILRAALSAGRSGNRRARETFACLLINYAVMLHDANASVDERMEIVRACVGIVTGGERDEEVLYRCMVAAGTVMCDSDGAARKAVEEGIAQAAADVAPLSGRLQQVATEIATLIAV